MHDLVHMYVLYNTYICRRYHNDINPTEIFILYLEISNHPYIQRSTRMYDVRYVLVISRNTTPTPEKVSPLNWKTHFGKR